MWSAYLEILNSATDKLTTNTTVPPVTSLAHIIYWSATNSTILPPITRGSWFTPITSLFSNKDRYSGVKVLKSLLMIRGEGSIDHTPNCIRATPVDSTYP